MSVGEKAPIWVKKGKFEMRNIERKFEFTGTPPLTWFS